MKKNLKKFLTLFFATLLFIFSSCENSKVKNEFGWYTDYETCLKESKKSGKKMLLLFSRDSNDEVSLPLKEKVLHTEEFKTEYSKDYNFCEIDLSNELFIKAKPPKDASKEDHKNAKKYKKILDGRMRIFTVLSPNATPSLFVLSKDGYVLNDITYIPVETVAQFKELMAMYKDEVSKMEALIQDVESKKGKEKVLAIDSLYEETNSKYRYQLTDLIRQVEKLDKKNETELVGKYVLALASSDAIDAYLDRKPDIVSSIYEKAAKSPMLTIDQKQQALFGAFYVIASNTPTEEQSDKMIELLEKTIEVKPDSEIAKKCESSLQMVKDFKARQEAKKKQIEEEGAPEQETTDTQTTEEQN